MKALKRTLVLKLVMLINKNNVKSVTTNLSTFSLKSTKTKKLLQTASQLKGPKSINETKNILF